MTANTRYWDTVLERRPDLRSQKLWRAHSDAVNCALLKSWLPKSQIACLLKTDLFDESLGDGLYSLMVSSTEHVFGMDISIRTLLNAKSRHKKLHTICTDVRCLPFANSSFDVIVSNSTLDHFDSRRKIQASLQELRRVLRPNGILILTLDNLANPIILLRHVLPFRLLNRLRVVPYYVGATYGPRRLHHSMEKVGFSVSDMYAIMHCPRVLAVPLARLLERLATRKTQNRLLRVLMVFECMAQWPTRFLTGYFIAVLAVKS